MIGSLIAFKSKVALKIENRPTSLFFSGKKGCELLEVTIVITIVSIKCKDYFVKWSAAVFDKLNGLFFGCVKLSGLE